MAGLLFLTDNHYVYSITISDVESLLNNAIRILNTYSILFRASSYSTQILGHDDYKYVLETIGKDIKRRDEELAFELASIQEKNSL